MAQSAWGHFKKTPTFLRIKLFLKRLRGRELWLKPEVRRAAVKSCGWWFDPDSLGEGAVVYSLGIGQDIGFEAGLIDEFGAEVHAFDPTPSSIDLCERMQPPAGFRFHPWAITAVDGSIRFYPRERRDGSASTEMYTTVAEAGVARDAIDVPTFTLQSVARKLGHTRIDLLKMDIEGAEYEVLEGLLDSPLLPTQLLVEFHHRFPGLGTKKTADIIRRLHDIGYRIFVVAETGRELGFIRQQETQADAPAITR